MVVKSETGSYPGFSERFNQLLDQADYPPLNRGRSRLLAETFAVSRSGARKWIRSDTPPRPEKLRAIIIALYEKTGLNSLRNAAQVISWLQYGDEVKSAESSGQGVFVTDHIMLSNIYLTVREIAKESRVNLEALPPAKLDRLYETIIEKTLEQDSAEPDRKFIKALLDLVKN